VYTFRNEYMFLPYDYGADPYREYDEFVKLGADGFFTDFPWSLSNYLNLTKTRSCNGANGLPDARPFFVLLAASISAAMF